MDALKSFKMALFFNPLNEMAKRAVAKLESLSATEFPADSFEMRKPQSIMGNQHDVQLASTRRERNLSLADAYIVRNEIEKARELLWDLRPEMSSDPEWRKRWEIVTPDLPGGSERRSRPSETKPVDNRAEFFRQRKIQRLKSVLHSLHSFLK